MNSVQNKSAATRNSPPIGGSVIGCRLQRYFLRYPPTGTTFARIGDLSRIAAETAMLQQVFGWNEASNVSLNAGKERNIRSSAICLLVGLANDKEICFDTILRSFPDVQLILLTADRAPRALENLENLGFRMLFKQESTMCFSNASPKITTLAKHRQLSDPNILHALTPGLPRIHHLPSSVSVDLLSVPGSILLTPSRFDIAIKCLYGRLWKYGRAKTWREYAYFEQALRITGPGPQINESDGTGKSGLDQFLGTFHSVLRETESSSTLPAVPVDPFWTAFDGAHRIAAGIVMDRPVRAVRIKATNGANGTSAFFSSSSHGHSPCPTEILDEAAIEYCRVKEGLAIALIFPIVVSDRFALDCLSDVSHIVHKKDISLSPHAGDLLLRQVYHNHAAFGENLDSGFANKTRSCFPFDGIVRVLLLDDCEPAALRRTKERIRAHYGVGNHSIHISDNDCEVLRVAKIVFNENSIDILRASVNKYPNFLRQLAVYQNWLGENGIDEESCCIDGSSLLALLGLREARDIDFIFHGDLDTLPLPPDGIDCHNESARHHAHHIPDILGDPRLHSWYMGIKFCAPHVVMAMKKQRGESKDLTDFTLLQSRGFSMDMSSPSRVITNTMRLKSRLRAGKSRLAEYIKKPLRPAVHAIRRQR